MSRCFLFACGEFSFDFVIDAKFVCQLLLALEKLNVNIKKRQKDGYKNM